MHLRLAWLLGFLLWAGTCHAHIYQSITDDVSATARLPHLEKTALPEGAVELRIWTISDLSPDNMVRLQHSADGKVSGELLRFASTDLTYKEDDAAFRKTFRRGCRQLYRGDQYEVCLYERKPRSGWRRMYESLAELGISTLPGQSPLSEIQTTGGQAIFVEVRQGSDYRNYSHNNPLLHDTPEARAMVRITQIVAPLFY